MATKRRLAGNIRRELIAAELERLRKENVMLRGFPWEFLSTHCAPLELRERALAAVGKPPLEFSRKEQDCEELASRRV